MASPDLSDDVAAACSFTYRIHRGVSESSEPSQEKNDDFRGHTKLMQLQTAALSDLILKRCDMHVGIEIASLWDGTYSSSNAVEDPDSWDYLDHRCTTCKAQQTGHADQHSISRTAFSKTSYVSPSSCRKNTPGKDLQAPATDPEDCKNEVHTFESDAISFDLDTLDASETQLWTAADQTNFLAKRHFQLSLNGRLLKTAHLRCTDRFEDDELLN